MFGSCWVEFIYLWSHMFLFAVYSCFVWVRKSVFWVWSWVHMSSISGLVSSSINNLFLWWSKIRCVNLEWFEFCKQWKLTSSLHYKALANVKFLLKIEGSHPLWMLRFSNTVTVHCDLLKKIFLVSICDHRFLPIANASDPKCDYQVHCEF